MAKVILQISYDINPESREQYLALSRKMSAHFTRELGKKYAVCEVRGKKNSFVEQFECASMEEFESLEDNMTESSEALVSQLEGMKQEGTTRYQTFVELA